MKFIETRSFLKAVVVIIIAIAIAVPAAYMFVTPTGTQALHYITARGATSQPDPTPAPDDPDTDDDGDIIYSSSSSSSGGGGGSDDDTPDERPRFDIKKIQLKVPVFNGEWGIGEYGPGAEAISELNGSLMHMILIAIGPDGTQETTRGREFYLKGLYQDNEIRIRIRFVDDGSATGRISYQGTYYQITDGAHWRDSQDDTLIIAQFSWDGEQYWLAGHIDK